MLVLLQFSYFLVFFFLKKPQLSPWIGQDAKADVILKYSADEARNLKSYGEMLADVYVRQLLCYLILWFSMFMLVGVYCLYPSLSRGVFLLSLFSFFRRIPGVCQDQRNCGLCRR